MIQYVLTEEDNGNDEQEHQNMMIAHEWDQSYAQISDRKPLLQLTEPPSIWFQNAGVLFGLADHASTREWSFFMRPSILYNNPQIIDRDPD